ncbi:MAG: hypothetical protein P8J35_06690 [Candidatus Marinimicrobia bacterium]|nr:hypothetical protein [Candidatus Neomarinimicrobiota bacterium]
MKKLFVLTLLAVLFFIVGCASHPVVHPGTLKKNEQVWGYSLAAENILPVVWFRKGLDAKTEIGYRVGLPIYGTGVDLSRVVMRREKSWDVMNFSWSYNPNRNIDITYYRFKEKSGGLFSKMKKKKQETPSISWRGTRFMLIPEGITPDKKSSMRLGFLRGGKISEKFGYEIGYYHDFNAMPLSKVFDSKWNVTGKDWQTSSRLDSSYGGRYDDYDPMFPGKGSGAPSEYSRATGFSLQLFYYLGRYKKKS